MLLILAALQLGNWVFSYGLIGDFYCRTYFYRTQVNSDEVMTPSLKREALRANDLTIPKKLSLLVGERLSSILRFESS